MRLNVQRGLLWLVLVVPCALARQPLSLTTAMAGRQGVALVLDVKDGRLLASHSGEGAARRRLRPGSTIKPLVLAALLEAGRLREDEAFPCRRTVRLAGRNLDCGHSPLPYPVRAAEALAYSCNDFVARVALRLSALEQAEALRRFQLDRATALVPREAEGEVRRAANGPAQQLQALGEGDVLVTPLGLAQAYRQLAGRRAVPSLRPVWEGLVGAATFGTGRLASVPGVTLAGKTGTATVADGLGRHAWFVGVAPVEQPEVIVLVLLERGYGGADAAPVAGLILREWLRGRR